MTISDHIRHDDWKKEKHVPVIELPEQVMADQMFQVTVTVGKEIAHPNTTEHHIRWIELYFMPEGGQYIYDIARFEFNAHGESVKGPNTGPVYTHFHGSTMFKTTVPGKVYAVSYCNIHGLWESTRDVTLVGMPSQTPAMPAQM